MSVFNRNISVDIEETPDGALLVKSHMKDLYHDILVELTVARPGFVIKKADVRMGEVPGADLCREVYPLVKQLEGLSIAKGFIKKATSLLGGSKGCPNVLDLVLVGAPLAINVSWSVDVSKGIIEESEARRVMAKSLDGVCIAYTGRGAEAS